MNRTTFLSAVAATVMLGAGAAFAGDAGEPIDTVLTFDDVDLLSEYGDLGVTFSENAKIVTFSNPCSVIDDPSCGPFSIPSSLCFGECGGETGTITFDAPMQEVSIYALSGPGGDLLNLDVFIEAFDVDGNLLGTAVADDTKQFDLLTIQAEGIVRVDLHSPLPNAEAWDQLTAVPDLGGPPACPGDIDGDGQVGINDIVLVLSFWGLADGDLDGDGVTGINDLVILLSFYGPCEDEL